MSLPTVITAVPAPGRSSRHGRGRRRCRPAFTLVELLIVVITIMILLGLTGAALSAARGTQRKQATETLIGKLDAIVMQAYVSHGSRSVPAGATPPTGMTPAAHRAWYVRRHFINGDLPDRWSDVQFIAENPAQFTTATQRAYAAAWNAMNPKPTSQYGGAECLFLIVMRGGAANCLDCNDLRSTSVRDKDNDGAPEFWDSWENPIAFILWPAALELPSGSGVKFFSGSRVLDAPFPATGAPAPGLRMLPLIYSAGPDGEYGLERNGDVSNLSCGSGGRDCGNWQVAPTATSAGPLAGAADNVTNLDAEAAQP